MRLVVDFTKEFDPTSLRGEVSDHACPSLDYRVAKTAAGG
jgi:hypothetical protein